MPIKKILTFYNISFLISRFDSTLPIAAEIILNISISKIDLR